MEIALSVSVLMFILGSAAVIVGIARASRRDDELKRHQ
jgi:hypothetical protein